MLYKKLSECKIMPSLLSIVQGYCDAYIPRSKSGSLPKPLTSLFKSFFNKLLVRILLLNGYHRLTTITKCTTHSYNFINYTNIIRIVRTHNHVDR